MNILERFMEIASKEVGVKELPDGKNNPRIIEYDSTTTLAAKSDEVPWCSSFVNWVVTQAGEKGTDSAAARSWIDWGMEVKTPMHGAIAIFKRGKNPAQGHVGFLSTERGAYYVILGGNQSNSVCYAKYPKSDLIGFRVPWPNVFTRI